MKVTQYKVKNVIQGFSYKIKVYKGYKSTLDIWFLDTSELRMILKIASLNLLGVRIRSHAIAHLIIFRRAMRSTPLKIFLKRPVKWFNLPLFFYFSLLFL